MPPRPQVVADLGVQFLEVVPDLGLGPTCSVGVAEEFPFALGSGAYLSGWLRTSWQPVVGVVAPTHAR